MILQWHRGNPASEVWFATVGNAHANVYRCGRLWIAEVWSAGKALLYEARHLAEADAKRTCERAIEAKGGLG